MRRDPTGSDAPTAGSAPTGLRHVLLAALVLVCGLGAVLRTQVPPAPPDLREGTERDGYRFLFEVGDGEPVRWDPCAAIRWEIDAASLPDAAAADEVRRTLDVFALDPSLPWFEFVGMSTRPIVDRFGPSEDVDVVDAPVLLGFGSVAAVTDEPDVVGLGGPNLARVGDRWQYVSGRVMIDSSAWRDMTPLFRRRVVMHEVLHVLGLDHTTTPGQTMSEGHEWDLGDGDRAGIAALLAGPCG